MSIYLSIYKSTYVPKVKNVNSKQLNILFLPSNHVVGILEQLGVVA